jgi:hypothetical protein
LDTTADEIPHDFSAGIVHINLSPELFGNHFQIWDQLFLGITFGFYRKKDGSIVSFLDGVPDRAGDVHSRVLLMEVPVLEDTPLTRAEDFPIALHPNIPSAHPVFMPKDDAGAWSRFIKVEPRVDIFEIDEGTQALVDELFTVRVRTYAALIVHLAHAFFPNVPEDFAISDLRLLVNTQRYFTSLVKLIPGGDRVSTTRFFVLLCRNLFEVLPALFRRNAEPPSLVVLPRQLMGELRKRPEPGWIVVTNMPPNRRPWQLTYFHADLGLGGISDGNLVSTLKLPREHFIPLECKADAVADPVQIYALLGMILDCFPSFTNHPQCMAIMAARLLSAIANGALPGTVSHDYFAKLIDKYTKVESEFERALQLYVRRLTKPLNNLAMLEEALFKTVQESPDALAIASMAFSPLLLVQFLHTVLKIYLRIFVVLEGNTGIGKTRSITLIQTLIRISNTVTSDFPPVPWSTHTIDFHGGLTQADVKRRLDSCIPANPDHCSSLVFLDEVNTSAAGGYALNCALDPGFATQGRVFVAAVNKLEKMDPISLQLIRSGIPQKLPQQISGIRVCGAPMSGTGAVGVLKTTDRSEYAYNVLECPAPIKNFVISVEPRPISPSDPLQAFLTADERQVIRSMIHFGLFAWLSEPEMGPNRKSVLRQVIRITKVLSTCLCAGFQMARAVTGMRPILSFRDVARVIELFKWVFKCVIAKPPGSRVTDQVIISAARNGIVIALFLGFFLRFNAVLHWTPEPGKQDKVQQFLNEREKQFKGGVLRKADGFLRADVDARYGPQSRTLSLRKILMNAVRRAITALPPDPKRSSLVDIVDLLPKDPVEWETEVLKFSFFKCSKYVNSPHIAKLPVLMYHLLLIKAAAYASRHEGKSTLTSVLLIGAPGMSKSLAVNLYAKFYTEKDLSQHTSLSHMSQYLCSRSSEAGGLEDQFRDAAEFYQNTEARNRRKLRICVLLDEIGLGNLNPRNPLKVMHAIQDRGIQIRKQTEDEPAKFVQLLIVETSNYALDFAIQNRGLLHCSAIPEDSEFEQYIPLTLPPNFYRSMKTTGYLSESVYKAFSDHIDSMRNVAHRYLRDLWGDSAAAFGNRRPRIIPMRSLHAYFHLRLFDAGLVYENLREFHQRLFELVTTFQTAIDRDDPAPRDATERQEKAITITRNLAEKIAGASLELPEINHLLLLRDLLQADQAKLPKSLLIRTNEYAALDLLPRLLDSYREWFGIDLPTRHFFFQTDHRRLDDDSTDKAFKDLLDAVLQTHVDETSTHWFVVTGNAVIADYILDLLNIDHPENENWSPVLLCHGYPIRLLKCPPSIRFVFILNDADLKMDRENPVPIPLLDRLIHLSIDKGLWQASRDSDDLAPLRDHFNAYDERLQELQSYAISDFELLRNDLQSQSPAISMTNRPACHQCFEAFVEWIISPALQPPPLNRTGVPCGIILTRTSPLVPLKPPVAISDVTYSVISLFDIDLTDSSSLETSFSRQAKERINLILVVRSSLFLIGARELATETDRRYHSLLDEFYHPELKLAVIVYSLTTSSSLPGLTPLSGWPVVWIQDLIPTIHQVVPLRMIASSLRDGRIAIEESEKSTLFAPALRRAIEEAEASLPWEVKPPSILTDGILALPQRRNPRRVVLMDSQTVLERLARQIRPIADAPDSTRRLCDLKDDILNGKEIDAAAQFFAIVSSGVITEGFRLALWSFVLRSTSMPAQAHALIDRYINVLFPFAVKYEALLPKSIIPPECNLAAQAGQILGKDLRPVEFFYSIVSTFLNQRNVDSIRPYSAYLIDLDAFCQFHRTNSWKDFGELTHHLFGSKYEHMAGVITDTSTAFTLTLELLVYRGVFSEQEKHNEFTQFPHDRYAPYDGDLTVLEGFSNDLDFFIPRAVLQKAFRTDFALGSLVQKTRLGRDCHPWAVARGYLYSDSKKFAFESFYPASDGYNFGGDQRVSIVFLYGIFCSPLLSRQEHFGWIRDVLDSGHHSSEGGFALTVSPSLMLTYVELDYVNCLAENRNIAL